MFNARIWTDSVNPDGGRLTTAELTYPRCIHSEFLTHTLFSRNSASSRAIPVEKMLANIMKDPFIPIHWGKNQKGMQANEELTPSQRSEAEDLWLYARDRAVSYAQKMLDVGLHKQITNRVVEPWMWITVIASGTSIAWENFFNLRCDAQAEPHIQKIAYMIRDLYDANKPKELKWGEWHLPITGPEFPGDELIEPAILVKVSVGRCARVSFLTHDGKRDPEADIALHDRLTGNGHWSPFGHAARAMKHIDPSDMPHSDSLPAHVRNPGGNFGPGWFQYRKMFATEVCGKAQRNPSPWT